MSEPMAIRLDAALQERIRKAARRRGTSRSSFVREAIVDFLVRSESAESARPIDLVQDLLGVVSGGDPDRSTDVGRKVRQSLAKRRKPARG